MIISKIKVVYKNQDVTKEIKNTVSGKLELLSTNQTETKTAKAKTEQEYKVNIKGFFLVFYITKTAFLNKKLKFLLFLNKKKINHLILRLGII